MNSDAANDHHPSSFLRRTTQQVSHALPDVQPRQRYMCRSRAMSQSVDVDVAKVDPRDQVWQIDDPTFRVYFWSAVGDAMACDQFEVRHADVTDVLAWAAADPQRRDFTLYLRHDDAAGVGLVRLAGREPTSSA